MTSFAHKTSFALYVFDFDGVLFDSARECFELAIRAVRRPPWQHAIEAGAARHLHDNIPEMRSRFLRLRHHVGPPWQYGVLLKLIAEDRIPPSVAGFLHLAEELKPVWGGFTADYFAERAALSADVDRWTRLFRAHEPAISLLRGQHVAGRARILSTRDSTSIRSLLAMISGIELAEHSLLARAGEKEKWELLTEMSQRMGIAPQDVFFLDDYVPHLLAAQDAGYATFLAGWGYLAPEDHETAARAGLPVLTLDDLVNFS